MWFVIGFALACGFYVYGQLQQGIVPLILLGLAVGGAGILVKKIRWLSFCALGWALALLWCTGFASGYLRPAKTLDNIQTEITITVTDYSWETAYGSAVDGKVELEGKSYLIRAYLKGTEALEPGDTVSGSFRLRYTPGGAESATFHPGKGIFLLGYQRGETEIVPANREEFYASKLARAIKVRLQELLPEDVFAFSKALLLGDSSDLDYETETNFRVSGIRHIIAVSGLHVTILYSLLSTITLKKRFLTALISFPALLVFAAVAGFTPSVTRACIMVGLMILAQVLNKVYDAPTALSFAALVMLIANPMVITSVSFQLSVGCVAGIQLFQVPISQWMRSVVGEPKGKGIRAKVKRWVISSVSVTLGAMSLTTPLCAYYFGAVSLIGLVANLLTLWLVQSIFIGLVAMCLVSFASVKLAAMVGWAVAWLIRLVLAISDVLASVPLAAVYTKSVYVVAWIIFVYILLAVFMLCGKRHPGRLIGCVALGLCLAVMASWAEPRTDDLRVTVLDVGQGQSILLQTDGQNYLVDCGGDSDTDVADLVAETLLSQGIYRLDGIIITHCDTDHMGALANLLTRVTADIVLYPDTEPLTLTNTELYPVSKDLNLSLGQAKLAVFGPLGSSDDNENSLCILFTVGDCDILITGDRGSLGESALLSKQLPDVELLIAGHHGSKYSTTEALLEAVRPEYIFVSAGADNSYGHPAQEMLDRAEKIGAQVYRTDLHGTLTFRR